MGCGIFHKMVSVAGPWECDKITSPQNLAAVPTRTLVHTNTEARPQSVQLQIFPAS